MKLLFSDVESMALQGDEFKLYAIRNNLGNVFRVLESRMCMTETKTDCRQTDRQTGARRQPARNRLWGLNGPSSYG